MKRVLRTTWCRPISLIVAARRRSCASVVARLEGVGVFCLELFQLPSGKLLINEIAPRPHNSGHYTLDACSVSQFEQQVRAICGMPLGEVRLLSPAVMVNLIGDDTAILTKGTGCRTLWIFWAYSISTAIMQSSPRRWDMSVLGDLSPPSIIEAVS